MKKNLIYMCVFNQVSYINLLELLVKSIKIKGAVNPDTTDILIITSESFQPLIQEKVNNFNLQIKYHIRDIYTLMESSCCKVYIFNYENIDNYDKILYLDTDVLINNKVDILFNNNIESTKIYALSEGTIGNETNYWGKEFFDYFNAPHDRNMQAFCAGVLFFKNSPEMKKLFNQIIEHINTHIASNKPIPICLDQPFVIYNSFINDAYDIKLMDTFLANNPTSVDDRVIYHFPGGPGDYNSKIQKMSVFWSQMYE